MEVAPIYCAEQIKVPPQLAEVLKAYTKEVIRRQPEDVVDFSAHYFASLATLAPPPTEVDLPSVSQISAVFKGLAASASIRTCDVDAIRQEAVAVGISESTIQQVLRVGHLGSTSALDPMEFCLLLATTAATDVRSLVLALTEVFGESGSLDSDLCREIFGTLGKHDPRWGGDFLATMEEQLPSTRRIAHNTLVELPCIRALS